MNWRDSKRQISKNTISYWIRDLILKAHKRNDKKLFGKVKAHTVRSISASLGFTANRSLYQVLKAGTWTRHNTFTNFYLKRFSVRKLDKFAVELGPLIAAQSVVGAANSSK